GGRIVGLQAHRGLSRGSPQDRGMVPDGRDQEVSGKEMMALWPHLICDATHEQFTVDSRHYSYLLRRSCWVPVFRNLASDNLKPRFPTLAGDSCSQARFGGP